MSIHGRSDLHLQAGVASQQHVLEKHYTLPTLIEFLEQFETPKITILSSTSKLLTPPRTLHSPAFSQPGHQTSIWQPHNTRLGHTIPTPCSLDFLGIRLQLTQRSRTKFQNLRGFPGGISHSDVQTAASTRSRSRIEVCSKTHPPAAEVSSSLHHKPFERDWSKFSR